MARLFDGTDDVLSVDSVPLSAYPFSIACWILPSLENTIRGLVAFGDKDVANHYATLELSGSDTIRAGSAAGGTQVQATATLATTQDAWNHVAGVWTSATARAAFQNGGNKGTSVTNRVFPTTPDRINVGVNLIAQFYPGRIAEVGIWNTNLSDAEVAVLARGVSPLRVRPANLVFYAPLFGTGSPEPDYTNGGRHLTVSGPSEASGPPVAPLLAGDLWLPTTAATLSDDRFGTAFLTGGGDVSETGAKHAIATHFEA